MFIKSFTLSFPLLLWIATPCFAETVEVRTNEPSSQYLGMKIDLVGRAFVDSFSVAPGKSLFISKSLTDVRIKKDNVDGLNKFHALVAYSLHSGNAKPSEPRFLYGVVCGRGRNPTLRLWPTIFSGKIDVFPGDRRSRLISSMTSVAPA